MEKQTEVEHKLAEELTEARKSIDGQIAEVQTRRSHILNAPPWGAGGGSIPSVPASEQKARRFIEEVTGKPPGNDLEGLSLDALLESAEKSILERRTQGQGSLEKEAAELAERRVRLENLRNIRTQIGTQKSAVQSTQSDLETVLNGLTSDELREKLATARYEATTESIKVRIVQDAIALISRDESKEFPCPICDSPHDRQILESVLQGASGHPNDDISSTVAALESQIQKSVELEKLLKEQKPELRSLNHNAAVAMIRIGDEDKKKLTQTDDIDELIRSYSEKESAVKSQIDDQETWFTSKRAQLDRLKEESRFHQIQRRFEQLAGR